MRGTKETRRNNKGITLIALIITIIVMLILVAVTITVAVNGGLFEYAGRAGKETKEAIKNEQLLAEGIINGQTIDDIVGIAVKDDWYGAPATELPTDEDGNYHIKTCAELAKFASMVNEGDAFTGKTVYLDKNLDLQGNENKQWTPIGVDYNTFFNGTFDGQNHFINGIYIAIGTDYQVTHGNVGLFGRAGNNSIIKNLGVDGYIEAGNCSIGGIVGTSSGTIENCYNKATINCIEAGDDQGVGGIAGFFTGDINKCYNEGTINAEYMFVGGIIGYSASGNIIENCYNKGKIITYNCELGGIIGYAEDNPVIKNCYNIGDITDTTVGQILGQTSKVSITNCYFLGTDEDNAVGRIDGSNVTVEATAKTETEMKTQGFVDLLNAGQTTEPWKRDSNKNNGYPILNWQ